MKRPMFIVLCSIIIFCLVNDLFASIEYDYEYYEASASICIDDMFLEEDTDSKTSFPIDANVQFELVEGDPIEATAKSSDGVNHKVEVYIYGGSISWIGSSGGELKVSKNFIANFHSINLIFDYKVYSFADSGSMGIWPGGGIANAGSGIDFTIYASSCPRHLYITTVLPLDTSGSHEKSPAQQNIRRYFNRIL